MAIGVFGLQVAYKLKRTELMSTDDTHGWFGGGLTAPGPLRASTVDRIDFSNDTGTANVRGPLTLARESLAATGNSNYGWFGGGYAPTTTRSTVDRIDFSNDSSTASVRGPLSSVRYNSSATGNSNYGWFGGGSPGSVSTVNRIDFSNDSSTASVRGPLSLGRTGLAATGNSNYGWFGHGIASGGYRSTVDRIDFSNDSSTASVRGPLSREKISSTATSGQAKGPAIKLQKAGNYGWFGGGITVPAPVTYVATIDRIDFSNDSTTATPRSSLSLARGFMGVTGNSNYGWFGGGFNGSLATTYSQVDRIDFANDFVNASPRGLLSASRSGLAATGNSNYGWFGGGSAPGPLIYATVDRIDFSNDSSTASVRGPLSLARSSLAATGNSNYGWFGGGLSGPSVSPVSTVDRIDFSNDSSTASVRGPLSSTRYRLAATSNTPIG